jgi:hypothetical protein
VADLTVETLRVFTHSVVPIGTNDTEFGCAGQEVTTMNTTAITWLGRQIAWEARLAELRSDAVVQDRDEEILEAA